MDFQLYARCVEDIGVWAWHTLVQILNLLLNTFVSFSKLPNLLVTVTLFIKVRPYKVTEGFK